jgi:predicted GNAT family N-acyltransferase
VRVSDEAEMDEFLHFVRARHFLARKRSRTLVHVTPLVALSERTDRGRVARLIGEWEARNAGRRAELLSD